LSGINNARQLRAIAAACQQTKGIFDAVLDVCRQEEAVIHPLTQSKLLDKVYAAADASMIKTCEESLKTALLTAAECVSQVCPFWESDGCR
jgi:hypothetical protein